MRLLSKLFPRLRQTTLAPPIKYCCSFCEGSPESTGPLVESPGKAYICRDCVEYCRKMFDETRAKPAAEMDTVRINASDRATKRLTRD